MKIPKTLTGIGVIVFGGLSNLIPVVGPVVSPWIMRAGFAITVAGGAAKTIRYTKGGDAWEHEKNLLKKKGK